VLLNPHQRVIRVGIDIEKDAMVIDSIIAKHEKSIKEREKREKEKEKKSKKKKEKSKKRK
jgi:cytochrome c-type biogenesis protein CcmE